MSKYTTYPLLCIIAFMLIASFIECSQQPDFEPIIERTVNNRIDSSLTTVDRTSPPILLRKKLTRRGRLLALDTVINRDTVQVRLEQDSTVTIRLLPAPRITHEWVRYLRRDSVIRERQVIAQFVARPWYESPLLVLAGAVLGFLLAIVL